MRALDNGNAAIGVFHGRRIAVTGGAGFLGRVVVRKLHERGCTDVTVPRRASCDLSRWDHIEQLFDKFRPHLLVHLAATVDSPAGHRDVAESFYNNVMMTTQLIEASSRHGVEKMICIGSASSYPANAPVPLREQDLFKELFGNIGALGDRGNLDQAVGPVMGFEADFDQRAHGIFTLF